MTTPTEQSERGRARPIQGHGALGVWHDVAAGAPDVDDWYDREHHAERVAIPGFLRARRYRNLGTGLGYFSRYDTTEAEVLGSAPYLHALDHPSPWSQRIFPFYRNTVRGAFRVTSARAVAEGGELVSVRLSQEQAATSGDLLRLLPARLIDRSGVVGVEVWEIDVAATTPPTRERDIRGAGEPFPGAAIMIDASRSERALEALEQVAGDLARSAIVERFRLVFQKIATHD